MSVSTNVNPFGVTSLPGGITGVTPNPTAPPPTNIGTLSDSTSTGNTKAHNEAQNTSHNQSENSSQGTGGSTSGSTSSSGSESFIPDFVQQLAFLNQYGNMAGQLSQQQYNWAQNEFANNSALTHQNINDYLKQSDMAGQGAGRDYQNYNDIFTPAASSLNQDWQSYVSPERVSSEMGAAEATQAQAFEGQRNNIQRSLESYGINPSDPRYAGAMAANRTAEGASQAAAGTAARLNTENTGRQLRQGALNEAHLLPGQTATEQNVAMQGLTGATNAAFGNTSLGALTMGTTPQYLNAGVQNNKFQPLGTTSGSTGATGSGSYNQSSSGGTSYGDTQGTSSGDSTGANNSNSHSAPVVMTPAADPNLPYGHYAGGGAIPDPGQEGGGGVPPSMSPSGGQQVDDIPAQIEQTGGQARLNAGEFVIPQDVTEWMGQKFFQDLIMKSRKARMSNPGPAHPTQGPGGEQHALGGVTNVTPTEAGGRAIDAWHKANEAAAGGTPPKAVDGPYTGPGSSPTAGSGYSILDQMMAKQGGGGPTATSTPGSGAPDANGRMNSGQAVVMGTGDYGAGAPGSPNYHGPPMRLNPQNNQWEPDVGQTNNRVQEKPSPVPVGPKTYSNTGPAQPYTPPQVSQPAPQLGPPTVGSYHPTPAIPHQAPANAPLPTGHKLMAGGDYSVAVQHNGPGSNSRFGQGLAPGQQPTSSAFQPKNNYFTPPNPFQRQGSPVFNPVANTPPPPPPSFNRTPPSPSSVMPPLNVQPAAPRPNMPTGGPAPTSSPVVAPPTAPVGVQPPKTTAAGPVPHDNAIHPMLANDVDQLLTWGDQEAQRNRDLYAKHGIPMPEGVTFGNPKDPTSFAYQGG